MISLIIAYNNINEFKNKFTVVVGGEEGGSGLVADALLGMEDFGIGAQVLGDESKRHHF